MTKRLKKEESVHHRASRQMDRAECDGWLHREIQDNDPCMMIDVVHKSPHKPYENIELPLQWRQYIDRNLNMTPSKACYYYVLCELSFINSTYHRYGRKFSHAKVELMFLTSPFNFDKNWSIIIGNSKYNIIGNSKMTPSLQP